MNSGEQQRWHISPNVGGENLEKTFAAQFSFFISDPHFLVQKNNSTSDGKVKATSKIVDLSF